MISLADIQQAQARIRGVAARTPLLRYYGPEVTDGGQLWLKPESLQPIGSFKLRGAYNMIASLTDQERRRGVITYSSGNHAQGVAYAARALQTKAVIVMPRNAPKVKIDATVALGAEIDLVGPGSLERQQRAEALAAEHGYVIIPPFNDERIIAGPGTIGLEILEDLKDVDLVLAPVGGGGLISGIASAIKLSGSKAKVVGVEPELANDAHQSFRAGKLVQISPELASSTLADGLRTQQVGPINFEHIMAYVDDIITVGEIEIRAAMRKMVAHARIVPEPSGAVTFAAWLLHQRELPAHRKAVVIVSGGNIEAKMLAEIICE